MKRAFSRVFFKQLDKFNNSDRGHLLKAVDRVMNDPTLKSYERPYLKQHRQEHPANPTHTIFFEYILASDVVLFVWSNDYSCLHTTRKATDPCVEKFGNLRTAGDIDIFNQDYHLGDLDPNPKADKPVYITFEALDYEVYFHVLKDEEDGFYSLMLSYDDKQAENVISITSEVIRLFLDAFAEHLNKQGQQFQFRFEPNNFNQELINFFKTRHQTSQWIESEDDEYFYLTLR